VKVRTAAAVVPTGAQKAGVVVATATGVVSQAAVEAKVVRSPAERNQR
tara:strand:- start:294 stop:437 length:144 start_codon:yes stop_codon:yes gene_type:complete